MRIMDKELKGMLKREKSFKKQLKRVLGKVKGFTTEDFEKYILTLYGVQFYNSLEEFYEIVKGESIRGHDLADYIYFLGYDTLLKDYKVTQIIDPENYERKATIYYNYQGNLITNMYAEGENIGYMDYYNTFIVGWYC